MDEGICEEVEPILGRVQKPSRYIGLAEGAPAHHPDKVAWLRLRYSKPLPAALSKRREPLPLPPTAAVASHAPWRAPFSRSPHDGTERTLGPSRGHPPARAAETAGAISP